MPERDTEKNQGSEQAKHKCPTCGKRVTAEAKSFPFCSPRCRQIDLGRWLKEEYVISRPIEQSDLEEGE